MGISGTENKTKMVDSKELIMNLKKVFSNSELKIIVQQLQKLKQAKDEMRDITQILRSIRLAMFKDQKEPSETDKLFSGKQACLQQLKTFIPIHYRDQFCSYFRNCLEPGAQN